MFGKRPGLWAAAGAACAVEMNKLILIS